MIAVILGLVVIILLYMTWLYKEKVSIDLFSVLVGCLIGALAAYIYSQATKVNHDILTDPFQ